VNANPSRRASPVGVGVFVVGPLLIPLKPAPCPGPPPPRPASARTAPSASPPDPGWSWDRPLAFHHVDGDGDALDIAQQAVVDLRPLLTLVPGVAVLGQLRRPRTTGGGSSARSASGRQSPRHRSGRWNASRKRPWNGPRTPPASPRGHRSPAMPPRFPTKPSGSSDNAPMPPVPPQGEELGLTVIGKHSLLYGPLGHKVKT